MPKRALLFSIAVLVVLAGLAAYMYTRSSLPSAHPVPGTCKILEEKYCQAVKFVTLTKDNIVFAAYTVPSGTTVFSPHQYEYLQTFSNIVFFGDVKKLVATTSLGSVQSTDNVMGKEFNITFYTHEQLNNLPKDDKGKVQQVGIAKDKIGTLASTTRVINNLPYTLLVLVRENTFPIIHPAPLNVHPMSSNITQSFLQK